VRAFDLYIIGCRVRGGVPDAPAGPGEDAAAAAGAAAPGAGWRRAPRPPLLRGRRRLRAQNVPARECAGLLEGRGAPGARRDPQKGCQGPSIFPHSKIRKIHTIFIFSLSQIFWKNN